MIPREISFVFSRVMMFDCFPQLRLNFTVRFLREVIPCFVFDKISALIRRPSLDCVSYYLKMAIG